MLAKCAFPDRPNAALPWVRGLGVEGAGDARAAVWGWVLTELGLCALISPKPLYIGEQIFRKA